MVKGGGGEGRGGGERGGEEEKEKKKKTPRTGFFPTGPKKGKGEGCRRPPQWSNPIASQSLESEGVQDQSKTQPRAG